MSEAPKFGRKVTPEEREKAVGPLLPWGDEELRCRPDLPATALDSLYIMRDAKAGDVTHGLITFLESCLISELELAKFRKTLHSKDWIFELTDLDEAVNYLIGQYGKKDQTSSATSGRGSRVTTNGSKVSSSSETSDSKS